ncbi:PREDICTED: protein PML isoform X2 [Chrysochloris asiatica]|uniref:Protein PML n=1 Tax=Chrysochloris asiatica TaxID=185453 RepID=A0A9B0TJL4_CHRAS|nr:PREDICTED: protein PML isoform X2 [Chrysochloris asiatica]
MPPPEPPSEGHQSSPSPTEQTMKEEFQFLCCQRCKVEAKCPKLLSCLHTLCSGCLETSGMECPICQVPRSGDANIPALDNIFFESLQRHLSLYRQIKDACATCTRCRESADFWCFECEQFLCSKCFEAHQWYVKHEARPLADFHRQTVNEFLERMRKSNNIFCSNSRHHVPELTSIYCRGCSKPLCCSCALLDKDHSEDKCDISVEIKQRQEDLDTMTEALQEQECAFAAARTQLQSVISQLGKARANTEKLIQARVSEVVQQVQALENELLQSVEARYQSDNKEIIKLLEHLDIVLQRIRMGGMLVQKMKRYASDQEVLDMHSFLHKALCHLRQEEPQSLQVPVYTNSFEEFKEEFKKRLKGLVSSIAQETDAAQPRSASPEAASTPSNALDTREVDQPEEVQTTPEETLGLSETQPVTVVEQVPTGYPVPLFAFSINDPSYREEISSPLTPQKRKFCQTESPRKIIKTESEEEKETTLSQSPSNQPTPSTSTAVSPPHHDGPSSPRSPATGDEVSLPNNNHVASEPGEAEERVVVISSSEDSDAENSPSQEMFDSSSESSDFQLEGANPLRVLDDSISNFPAEDSPLVFFDLKIDDETQKISQLAAVNQESKFRVLIQPEAFSIYSKAVSLEVGLRHFLRFLNSMRHPILACSKLWGPGLPNFFQALEDMNSLWEFQEAVSGFLATLPLIQECVPGASSFKLKSLAKTYLARNMNERSALATVLTMRDLCRLFEIIPGPQLAQHVYSFCSLKCFASLQPLVHAAVLPRAEARLLALHNVSFLELLASHRLDPQGGLRKYCRYLSLQVAASPPTQPAFDLQALCAYFTGLLAQEEGISAPLSSHSLAKSASQQS